jgi:hypothetical protein
MFLVISEGFGRHQKCSKLCQETFRLKNYAKVLINQWVKYLIKLIKY